MTLRSRGKDRLFSPLTLASAVGAHGCAPNSLKSMAFSKGRTAVRPYLRAKTDTLQHHALKNGKDIFKCRFLGNSN